MAIPTASAYCSISAVVVPPSYDPSGVEVESVALIATYTLPMAEGERGVSFLAFGPDRQLVWLRSSGHLDSAEWCPACAHNVEGSNRDGGLPMPEGFWESSRLTGRRRRLVRAEVERDAYQAVDLKGYSDRLEAGETATAPKGQRWARFTPRLQGSTLRVRLNVPESLTGISFMDLVSDTLEGPGR